MIHQRRVERAIDAGADYFTEDLEPVTWEEIDNFIRLIAEENHVEFTEEEVADEAREHVVLRVDHGLYLKPGDALAIAQEWDEEDAG